MNLTTDDLMLIIGAKEAELFALRRRVAELEAQLQEVSHGPASLAD